MDTEICDFDRHEFHSLARRVFGIVFDVYNEFGWLREESIDKWAIMLRSSTADIFPARQLIESQQLCQT